MSNRETRLNAFLAQPERNLQINHELPGLLEDVTLSELTATVERIISTQAAGAALQKARQHRELSLRQAGQKSGRSAPRIKAIESTDVDIRLGTVVEHARALGYGVHLSLTPVDGLGPVIQADLSSEDARPQISRTLNKQMIRPTPSKKIHVKSR